MYQGTSNTNDQSEIEREKKKNRYKEKGEKKKNFHPLSPGADQISLNGHHLSRNFNRLNLITESLAKQN